MKYFGLREALLITAEAQPEEIKVMNLHLAESSSTHYRLLRPSVCFARKKA